MKKFEKMQALLQQFDTIEWIENSGINAEELINEIDAIEKKQYPKDIIKAKTFETILDKSRIAIDRYDIFQDKIYANGIMVNQRIRWEDEIKKQFLLLESSEVEKANIEYGAYIAMSDYGHTSPNSQLLVNVGFTGLLDRVEKAYQQNNLTDKQKSFYNSCIISLRAILRFLERMAEAIRPYNEENADALENIAQNAPSNIYEALQLIVTYFFLHEYVQGTRVRTLGRLDVMLYPFYKNDIESGRYTKEEIKEMLKFFFNKFWAAKVPFDMPLCLSGLNADGEDVTNELSYLMIESYNELDIHSPKIHIRISSKTPKDFVKQVLKCIRGGNSSFVFVNDDVGIKSLMNVGIDKADAYNYVPIGCYEQAAWGCELGCTGNGGVCAAKAIEFVFTRGVDFKSGEMVTVDTGEIETYEEFIVAVKTQLKFMADKFMDYVVKIERYYDKINPDPILSSMYTESVERGVDVYEGGAKYNNSSICLYSIASLVDSVCVVKKLVFEDKLITFNELGVILKNNWNGNEMLRNKVKALCEKYGNNNKIADDITTELTEYFSSITNGKPNGRNGVFKASIFTIDLFVHLGLRVMATPDGRCAGEPLSKNLCTTIGMDRQGLTGLINSVTKIDHAKFPNGSVLDIVLHPSSVEGEDGLEAFYAIVKTYMAKGGFAIHGNVFNPDDLKEAQKNPEKYATLQVRVCGWNAYFINLSKIEQDTFIKQAENDIN